MVVTMDTTWSTDNYIDENNLAATMDAAMTAAYNFPIAHMSSVPDQDDMMVSPVFESEQFAQATPRSRYVSLDYDRTDAGFLLPLERSHSLTNDAKESAKEVSNLLCPIDRSGSLVTMTENHMTC